MHTRERLARSSNGLPSLAAWALSAALAVPTPAEAGSTSVRAQIDINEVPDVLVLASKTAASFAEVGTLGDLYAKARVSYGNNGAYAMASQLPARFGAYAESIWMDGFTIDGPGGTGLLEVHVHGTLDDLGAPGSHGPKCLLPTVRERHTHELRLRRSVMQWQPRNPDGGGHQRLTDADGRLPFTYSKTFYLASFLGAEVLGEVRPTSMAPRTSAPRRQAGGPGRRIGHHLRAGIQRAGAHLRLCWRSGWPAASCGREGRSSGPALRFAAHRQKRA